MFGDYYDNNCTGVDIETVNRDVIKYSIKSYTGSLHTYNAFNNKLYTCSTTFNSPIYINKQVMSRYTNGDKSKNTEKNDKNNIDSKNESDYEDKMEETFYP